VGLWGLSIGSSSSIPDLQYLLHSSCLEYQDAFPQKTVTPRSFRSGFLRQTVFPLLSSFSRSPCTSFPHFSSAGFSIAGPNGGLPSFPLQDFFCGSPFNFFLGPRPTTSEVNFIFGCGLSQVRVYVMFTGYIFLGLPFPCEFRRGDAFKSRRMLSYFVRSAAFKVAFTCSQHPVRLFPLVASSFQCHTLFIMIKRGFPEKSAPLP